MYFRSEGGKKASKQGLVFAGSLVTVRGKCLKISLYRSSVFSSLECVQEGCGAVNDHFRGADLTFPGV